MSDVQRPLTDEELAAIEKEFTDQRDSASAVGILLVHEVRRLRGLDAPKLSANEVAAMERLVTELERLRSDEWLERAVAQYARAMGWQFDAPSDQLLAILRKHRDGAV
jgi:hypothetical protein